MSGRYCPTLDVAVVSYVEEDLTYIDKSTGERKTYPRRTLNWIAPEYGVVGSCPIPERLAPICRSLPHGGDFSKPTTRLGLASFAYEHGQLKISLDTIESITKAKP